MRLLSLILVPAALAAQSPPPPTDLAAERAEFARWLEGSPTSPAAAIYHQTLGDKLVLGPEGDPPLQRLPRATLERGRRLTLRAAGGTRTVPRNRDVPIGDFWLRVSGERDRSVVTVFGPPRDVAVPGWYPHAPNLVVEGVLEPPAAAEARRMLGLDGVEVEATHAGTFVADVARQPVRLTVFRMPEPGTEEAELMIFFRDATNDAGTYPAGRFLALRPLGNGRYRADFNRARNPFCAYNTIFPCPLPWRGNAIDSAVEAGEKYRRK